MKQSVDQSLRKAASLSARGDAVGAETIYREVLARFPSNKRALDGVRVLAAPSDPRAYEKTVEAILALYDQGRLREALGHLLPLIDLYPSKPDLENIAGAASAGLGLLDDALGHYDRAIALKPDYAEVHSNRATVLIGLQRFAEALASCDRAIRLFPDNAPAHSNRGIALKQLGRLDEAVVSYDHAIRLIPNKAEIHYNRANALLERKRPEEAVAAYDRAIALRPTYVVTHSNRGNALRELERLEEAADSYGHALALDPGFAEAHSNLGLALLGLDRTSDALQSCREAVELQPEIAELRYNLAVVLEGMLRFADALASYDVAIAHDPNHAKAHGNRGHVLHKLLRPEEAAESYARAVAIDPSYADGFYALGNIVQELGRLDEAVAAYLRAIAVQPDHGGAIAQLAYQRARMCDWESAGRRDLAALAGNKAINPLIFLWLEDAPQQQLLCARRFASEKYPVVSAPPASASVRSRQIRIGYFSAEFHDHAVMFQLVRMFELHDRDRFSVHAFSFGAERPSAIRPRLTRAFDAFLDVSAMGNREIAALAKSEGIDIAIDLMGYAGEARPELFALRPAPLQIQYMGYPGTMGAPFIDYLVADPILIPADQRRHYAEKILYLPETYQANDDRRSVESRIPSRAELGLPADGFIFCCFNNSFKISPAEFDIWMRLLAQVKSSVLWLFEANSSVTANLRREAEKRGIDPERLVFAEHRPNAEHLARLQQADLFLDCFTCNAHATASDALWAGVPVLTLPGRGFTARVGASLSHAIGLPELTVATREDYERLALDLATDPARLASLRARLAHNRGIAPLFDSERFTRHIEAGFALAHERFRSGAEPDHIEVPALPTKMLPMEI